MNAEPFEEWIGNFNEKKLDEHRKILAEHGMELRAKVLFVALNVECVPSLPQVFQPSKALHLPAGLRHLWQRVQQVCSGLIREVFGLHDPHACCGKFQERME